MDSPLGIGEDAWSVKQYLRDGAATTEQLAEAYGLPRSSKNFASASVSTLSCSGTSKSVSRRSGRYRFSIGGAGLHRTGPSSSILNSNGAQ